MARLPILQAPDPRLHETAVPVPAELFSTDELRRIIVDMAEALDEQKDGVAIAAPQLGIMYRIFLIRFDRTREPGPEGSPIPSAEIGVFINPAFVKSSRKRVDMDEGCLSVRGIYGTTYRYERATIRAHDENGKVFERGGGNLIAQIYQHETDHLDGILFIDHAHELVASKKHADADGESSEHPNHENPVA